MAAAVSYEKDVIREKSADGPILLVGETVRYRGAFAMPVTAYIVAFIVLFIPPIFIVWSAIVLGLTYYLNKHKTLWLTDKRLVYSTKVLTGFLVISVPISEIKLVRRRYTGGAVFGMLDRMLGTSSIQIHVKGSVLPQLLIQNVKDAGSLLQSIKSISAELVEGA